ncbi:hypothetical protein B0I37DRAFT_411923 [Chaetomium sp. MPI-CAGE-AT-0009]|nr:hypothetical protein B0I37DRAFT_411923 [Chaetomium sp. MPI-CAGE-AT-0009]
MVPDLDLALKALKEGDQVIAAVRSPSKIPDYPRVDGVKVLHSNLSFSREEMNDYAEKGFAAFGRVDALVNNRNLSKVLVPRPFL